MIIEIILRCTVIFNLSSKQENIVRIILMIRNVHLPLINIHACSTISLDSSLLSGSQGKQEKEREQFQNHFIYEKFLITI